MKKIALLILSILVLGSYAYADYYVPAWHSPYQNPYQAFNVFLYGAYINGESLQADDEIALYDGNTLVGAVKLTCPIEETVDGRINIKASMGGGNVPGSATNDGFVIFKIYDASTQIEYSYPELAVEFSWWNDHYHTTYGPLEHTFVDQIHYNTPSGVNTQTLTPPAGQSGGNVEDIDFPGTGVVLNEMWVSRDGGGDMTAYFFDAPALDVRFSGTPPLHHSSYGWYVDPGQIVYTNDEEYPIYLSFDITGLAGIADPATLVVYKRTIHGTGQFTACPTTYSAPYLTASIASFSEFILGSDNEDNTLPVELSSFSTTVMGNGKVSVSWVTQSENAVLGFRIFRATSDQMQEAHYVSPLISATNTSTAQYYQYVDREISASGTYYYWLESMDLDGGSSIYGPSTLVYNEQNSGQTPQSYQTGIRQIYPNPFNPATSIEYSLAKAAELSFVIYNHRGQLVRRIPLGSKTPGKYSQIWNGTDDSGRQVATGVYFIHMLAGKDGYVSKAVLLK